MACGGVDGGFELVFAYIDTHILCVVLPLHDVLEKMISVLRKDPVDIGSWILDPRPWSPSPVSQLHATLHYIFPDPPFFLLPPPKMSK
jgi:hypothetical protein